MNTASDCHASLRSRSEREDLLETQLIMSLYITTDGMSIFVLRSWPRDIREMHELWPIEFTQVKAFFYEAIYRTMDRILSRRVLSVTHALLETALVYRRPF